MYTDTCSTVLSTDGETPSFPILAGILQGDTLAPFLFIMVVDYVLRISVDSISEKEYRLHPRRSSRYSAAYLTDTDFADDIALVSQSLEHAQDLRQSLEQASNGVGLYLNETKTECMNRCNSNSNHPVKTLNGTSLKQVEDYKYLGAYISSSEKDFVTRNGMAWSACNDMHKIWSSQLPNNLKVKIFRATIEPILLYGSETWTLSDNKLKYHQSGSFQLVTSSATKNTVNSTVRGVGFLLSQKVLDNLLGITKISPWIIVLELEGNPKTTVICVYSPHNSSYESDVEDFYTTLRSTVAEVPLHNFLVISGHLNAKLGPENVKFTYNTETNRNVEHLIDFMKEFNLFSSNTSFMKPKGQLWTFEYPNGGRAQLDYLIFRKKWRNSVKDSRSY